MGTEVGAGNKCLSYALLRASATASEAPLTKTLLSRRLSKKSKFRAMSRARYALPLTQSRTNVAARLPVRAFTSCASRPSIIRSNFVKRLTSRPSQYFQTASAHPPKPKSAFNSCGYLVGNSKSHFQKLANAPKGRGPTVPVRYRGLSRHPVAMLKSSSFDRRYRGCGHSAMARTLRMHAKSATRNSAAPTKVWIANLERHRLA